MHKVYAVRGSSEFIIFTGTYNECLDYCKKRNWKWIAETWRLEITI